MVDLPKATKEMVRFIAEANAENIERAAKRERILKTLRKKRDQIAEALIGIGASLNNLNEQKSEIEEKLEKAEKELAYEDPNKKFMEKFGINMWSINQNPTLTQKEVDEATANDDEE